MHELETILPDSLYNEIVRNIGSLKPYKVNGLEYFLDLRRPTLNDRLEYLWRAMLLSRERGEVLVLGKVLVSNRATRERIDNGETTRVERLLVANCFMPGFELTPEQWKRIIKRPKRRVKKCPI